MKRDRVCSNGWRAAVGLGLVLSVALSGCRVDEQGRQLTLEKGTYQGHKDKPLSEEQRRELRERSMLGH